MDLLLRSNDAFRRGDWDTWSDPDWPEQRIYGRDAVAEWGRGIDGALDTDVRIEEIHDLGDRVVARVNWIQRGQESGIEGEVAWTEIATVRDGRFVFIEMFFDHGQALKAVGLEE